MNYLNVSLNISTGEYKSYINPGNMQLYISTESDHPTIVIKHLYKSIASRLSINLKNKGIFQKAKGLYQETLKK